ATLTRAYVKRAQGTSLVVRDTRKTLPGMRALAKYGVRTGGGMNHRLGLDDAILIKDNHLALAGADLAAAVRQARAAAPALPVEGRRAGGYTLAAQPDRLGPAELAPHLRGAWRRVHWLEEVDSTQRVARELARAGAPEGTTVIAERQSAGRGRLGRQWHSPAGVSLYCSIVLRPPLAPSAVPQLALVAGAAVAARGAEATGPSPGTNWPKA